MRILIDDKHCEAQEDATILETARSHDIPIPTLCWTSQRGGDESCRVCVVEVLDEDRPGSSRLACACSTRVVADMVVRTASEATLDARRMTLDLIHRREERSGCILCGRCVRICHGIGKDALCFAQASGRRHVERPAYQGKTTCTDCGLCVRVCPTGAIQEVGVTQVE